MPTQRSWRGASDCKSESLTDTVGSIPTGGTIFINKEVNDVQDTLPYNRVRY